MFDSKTPSDLDVVALDQHLRVSGVPRSGPLGVELVRSGRSNLIYKVFDDESVWVLRRPSAHGRNPSTRDVSGEFEILSALAGADVPVPKPVTACTTTSVLGVPFLMTEFVEGRVVRTRREVAQLAADGVRLDECAWAVVGALAALHDVAPEMVGLVETEPPEGYLERQIRRWKGQWSRYRLPGDIRDDAAAALCKALAAALPEPMQYSIVHGDFRIDKVVLDGSASRALAMVGWGMASLGDPLEDAALMCAYRDPLAELVIGVDAAWTSPLLPTAEALAGKYSRMSGRGLLDWNFYSALAYLRMAVTAAGVAHRARRGGVDDRAGDAVGPLLIKGLRILAKG